MHDRGSAKLSSKFTARPAGKGRESMAGEPLQKTPWAWVPSLYFIQGLPNIVATTVSVIMYKRLGVSNSDIALYTSWLYLPWVIKPLWGPLVDMYATKRAWIVGMQLVLAAALFGVAFMIPAGHFFPITIAIFWIMTFSSATYDIAADGFYMLGLAQYQQAAFVGVRSTFYRIANMFGQGLLVVLAGYIEHQRGNVRLAWSITFGVLAGIFLLGFIYHAFVLPRPILDRPTRRTDIHPLSEFLRTFAGFFRKPSIASIMAFLLFYRFAEAQLLKMVSPFLLDSREVGGLGMSTEAVGVAYGTVGPISILCGGLLGGYLISRNGLRYWLWPMVIIMHLPDLVFVLFSRFQPTNVYVIGAGLTLEQFGYGFGFTAYMLFMIMVAEGVHKTAHYALCTGFMALGLMVPQMFSGKIQEKLAALYPGTGYRYFFIWVLLATIPGFIAAALVKIDPEFGKKRAAAEENGGAAPLRAIVESENVEA
jgi:PAT family beta-lactamase induction signal transducer AmpG